MFLHAEFLHQGTAKLLSSPSEEIVGLPDDSNPVDNSMTMEETK